jgi:hypothetical protein
MLELIGGPVHPGDQGDHGDQHLGERRREQRACHSMWLEARDVGTDDSHGEHPEGHHLGVAFTPEDANGNEDECSRERNADGGSVLVVSHGYLLIFASLAAYNHRRTEDL